MLNSVSIWILGHAHSTCHQQSYPFFEFLGHFKVSILVNEFLQDYSLLTKTNECCLSSLLCVCESFLKFFFWIVIRKCQVQSPRLLSDDIVTILPLLLWTFWHLILNDEFPHLLIVVDNIDNDLIYSTIEMIEKGFSLQRLLVPLLSQFDLFSQPICFFQIIFNEQFEGHSLSHTFLPIKICQKGFVELNHPEYSLMRVRELLNSLFLLLELHRACFENI